jgi:hypothetical protein
MSVIISPRGIDAPAPRPLAVLTAFSGMLLTLTLAWAAFDDRLLSGSPVWAKPMKFALSFTVLFATLAWFERRLSSGWRDGRILRGTVVVMATAMLVEMGYMIIMAAQQQESHFNLSTPFTRFMYSVMGVGAVLLITSVATFGIAMLRDGEADVTPSLRLGIGWGCLLTFLLTLVTAGYMSSQGAFVGIATPGSAVLPLTGWSATVGDIRPAHFLALHAMQVLPLAGLWFDRVGIAKRRMSWVAIFYAALTGAVFTQALAGLPLLRL